MTRRSHLALLMAAALLAANCGSTTTPTGTLVTFSSKAVSASNPAIAVNATTSSKTIQVVGTITTSDACYLLSGSVTNTDEVTLRVSATANPAALCIAATAQFTYSASIGGLTAGTYRIKVIHAAISPETVVLSQVITVQ